MGESNDSSNGILLEKIDKEIPINFSLLTTPIKDTLSISKTSTISKLDNYIDENYDEGAKIQMKQAILREVKQQIPDEAKEKGHLDELLPSLHNQISSLKSEVGFSREEVKEKNNVIRTLLRRNSCKCNGSSPCQNLKLENISEINEEHRDTCISTNERQFTKLAKQRSRAKDVQVDSIIQADPDDTTHLTNTGVTFSNINEVSHIINKENRPPDKPPPPSENPANPQNSKTSVFIVGDSMIKKDDGYLLTSSLQHQYLVKTRPFSTAKAIDIYDYIKPIQRETRNLYFACWNK